jgi:hypothetical protein
MLCLRPRLPILTLPDAVKRSLFLAALRLLSFGMIFQAPILDLGETEAFAPDEEDGPAAVFVG